MADSTGLLAAVSAGGFVWSLYIVFFWLHSTHEQIANIRYIRAQRNAQLCIIGSFTAPFLFLASLIVLLKEHNALSESHYQTALWAAAGISAAIGVLILVERLRFRMSPAFDGEDFTE